MNQETKIKCPTCGTELTAHITIEEARGALNRVSKAAGKARRRIEALRAAGIDTTGMLAMSTGDVARLKDGVVTVLDEDEVMKAIRRGGTIPNGTLWRRWVTAQMFHMLAHPGGFTAALREKGGRYPWRMLANELHAQKRMQQTGDQESLDERKVWFGPADVNLIISQALANVRTADRKVEKEVLRCINPGHYDTAIVLLYNFSRSHDLPMPKAFIDSYKGAGAYFTMRDLIKFHGCRFEGLGEENSLTHLRMLGGEYSSHMEGYKMLGALKEFLCYNGIDVKQRITDWNKVRGIAE